ncbi:MAG: CocE/NonD family hydrolase [Bacillota bacterium]
MRYFEILKESFIMIPMRDGVRLACDLYFPARGGEPLPGRHPVILERTPYDRTGARLASDCRFFARRGYVVVAQDVRGRYDSEGELDPFGPVDVPDGHDTCVWIGEQPWCDGRIGTMGTSYSSMNQAGLAMSNPPHLASQFMNQGFSNNYDGRIRQGGALRQSMVSWIFEQATRSPRAFRDRRLRQVLERANGQVQKWLARSPIRRGQTPLRHLPEYEDHVIQISTRGDLDDWWRRPGPWVEDSWDQMPDVPRYLASGWYDSHSHVISRAYGELRRRQSSPVRLIMGPWTHGGRTLEEPSSGEAHFGAEAAIEWNELRLAWFDQTLRGMDAGMNGRPPVSIFVMGGGSGRQVRSEAGVAVDVGGYWRDEEEWPLARTDYRPLYLRRGGDLNPLPPADDEGSTTYRYNPLDPVPTVGGPLSSIFELRMEAGAFDQRARPHLGHGDDLPLSSRADVCVFATPPLKEGIEVTGPVEAVLYVSSSAPDTDFTVKLVDVYPPNEDFPDGVALNVTDGIRRARYRRSPEQPEMMTPGEVVEVRVELPPTSLYFAPGHSIRVDVSSSNWPRFDLNPNSGEPVGRHHRVEIARNTIHHCRRHPSNVILPVIEG